MTDDNEPKAGEEDGLPTSTSRAGEENTEPRSTPANNLIAAGVIGALAVAAMVLSLATPNPGASVFSAPGLLPFLTGASLFAMSLGLGVHALRAGAVAELTMRTPGRPGFSGTVTTRRTLLLIAMIFGYIVVTDAVWFEFAARAGRFTLRFSSFEAISIVFLTMVLRYFWRQAVWRCLAVATPVSVALAGVFSYVFHILLPGST